MRKFLAALAAIATALVLAPASPVAAADPPSQFGSTGWWNGTGDTSAKWEYANYPVPCYDTATGNVWVVIWVTKEGEAISIPTGARQAVNRAGSIFAASAKRTVSTWGQVRGQSYAPKWETSGSGDGNCTPQFNVAVAPATAYVRDEADFTAGTGGFSDGGLFDYLYDLGMNNPHFKYLVLKQTNEGRNYSDPDGAYAFSHVPGAVNNVDIPGDANPYNGTGFAYVPKWGWNRNGNSGEVIAHEMAHNMGAVSDLAPNHNDDNAGHAGDCGDIMCYNTGRPGEDFNNGCGSQLDNLFLNVPYKRRLDCNGDDYFNPGAAWGNTRWAVHNSAFLWPHANVAVPPTGGGAIVAPGDTSTDDETP